MKKDNIIVFSNDNFNYINKFLHFQNKNTFTIIDILRRKFEIKLISKRNKIKTVKKKKINNIAIENFFNFIKNIKNYSDLKFLFISITPFNFFYFLILKLFFIKKEKIFVFLRSDGFKEYQVKLPFIGYFLYFFMFKTFGLGSRFLSCSKYFTKLKKFKILLPSELDSFWLKKKFNKKLNKNVNLLYMGRFRKEKGYLSLIKIFQKIKKRHDNYSLNLTLVGSDKKIILKEKNIKILAQINNDLKLRRVYDAHQILILPSYTEGFPQVILESFARKKPVIVFDEIKFLKKVYPNGLFVSKRNEISFTNTIKFIIKNYSKILKEINKINLISKKNYTINLLKQIKN